VRVDLRAKKLADGGDYLAINPKGYVPALRLPDGDMLTEGAIIVRYIADAVPGAKLAPATGTMARYRHDEWLHFIATELHKATNPLYSPVANDDFKKSLKDRIALRFAILENGVRDQPHLMGEPFSVADGYAFYVMRTWVHTFKESLERWPQLVAYYQRVAARPHVAAALAAENLAP
jgi:glutathione S-transferase